MLRSEQLNFASQACWGQFSNPHLGACQAWKSRFLSLRWLFLAFSFLSSADFAHSAFPSFARLCCSRCHRSTASSLGWAGRCQIKSYQRCLFPLFYQSPRLLRSRHLWLAFRAPWLKSLAPILASSSRVPPSRRQLVATSTTEKIPARSALAEPVVTSFAFGSATRAFVSSWSKLSVHAQVSASHLRQG